MACFCCLSWRETMAETGRSDHKSIENIHTVLDSILNRLPPKYSSWETNKAKYAKTLKALKGRGKSSSIQSNLKWKKHHKTQWETPYFKDFIWLGSGPAIFIPACKKGKGHTISQETRRHLEELGFLWSKVFGRFPNEVIIHLRKDSTTSTSGFTGHRITFYQTCERLLISFFAGQHTKQNKIPLSLWSQGPLEDLGQFMVKHCRSNTGPLILYRNEAHLNHGACFQNRFFQPMVSDMLKVLIYRVEHAFVLSSRSVEYNGTIYSLQ